MDSNQCCQMLGISPDASFKEAKTAYRRLALKYHPDRNKDYKNDTMFKQVTEAYQVLRYQYKRKISRVSPYESNYSSNIWNEPSSSNWNNTASEDFHSHEGKQYRWQHDSWWEAPKDSEDGDSSSSAGKGYGNTEYDWEEFRRQTENAYKDFWSYQEDSEYDYVFWNGPHGNNGFRGKYKPEDGNDDDKNTGAFGFGNTRNRASRSSSEYEWFFNKAWDKSGAYSTYANYYGDDGEEDVQKEDENAVSVNVDESLCIGCCSCETIAPSVFYVDKHKRWNPKSNVINEKGDDPETVMDAAQTCPTKAIGVKKKKTGQALFPL